MQVKFIWNGIKADGVLHKAHYSAGPWTPESGMPANTITIYATGYTRFPRIAGLEIHNNTDIMRDYFENDLIRVPPDSPYYADVKAAYDKQEAHKAKMRASRRK